MSSQGDTDAHAGTGDTNAVWQFAVDTWTKANEAAYGNAMQTLYGALNLLSGQLPRLGPSISTRARVELVFEALDRDIGATGESLGQVSAALEAQQWDTVEYSVRNLRRCISNLDQGITINAARTLECVPMDMDWMVDGLDRSPRVVRAMAEPFSDTVQALAGALDAGEAAAAATAAVLSMDPVGKSAENPDQPHESELAGVKAKLMDAWAKFSSLHDRADSLPDESDNDIDRMQNVFGTSPSSLFTIAEGHGDGGNVW